jgi:hypothetical protein
MKQMPSWEASNSSASPENPHILWNPKASYCVPRAHNLSFSEPDQSSCSIF